MNFGCDLLAPFCYDEVGMGSMRPAFSTELGALLWQADN